jgi:hypothetical protein
VQEVKALLGSGPRNIASLYSQCSNGQANLDVSNSVVINVPFPCSGTLKSGKNFSINSCSDNNINEVNWHKYAAEYAERYLGYSVNRFHHRILIMPKNLYVRMSKCS